ncbi:MAG: hypothetical protein AB1765_03415 [Candidatus Hydrogenedentota bacterium]
MKTAVFIPDDIFLAIEKHSRLLKVSRSRLISEAAKRYISELEKQEILDTLNEVYAKPFESNIKRYKKHFAKNILRGGKY